MQQGFSLRAVVDKCAIPLTTLRNYRNRGIISPDVADKSGKPLSIPTLKLKSPKLIALNTRTKMTRLTTLAQTIARTPQVKLPTKKLTSSIRPTVSA